MRGETRDAAAGWAIRVAGWGAVAVLLGIFVMLAVRSLPAFSRIGAGELLSGRWMPNGYREDQFGIAAMVAGTGLVTGLSMLIAIPVGIGTAAYLAEFAPRWLRELLKPSIELLAAVPSVVVGFFGLVVVGPSIAPFVGSRHGLNAATGALLLAIMALPTIVSIAEDGIASVPREWREGSYALGAGRVVTLVRVTLPGARSSIVAAALLGVGRAMGETMTVLMATGNALAFPEGLASSVRTLTATIAIETGEAAVGSTHYHALFAVALALFVGSLAVNVVADWAVHRGGHAR